MSKKKKQPDQKPLPPKKPEIVNPEDEPAESQTDEVGEGNEDGEGEPNPGGGNPTNKPKDP